MTFLWMPGKHLQGALLASQAFSPVQTGKVSSWLRLAASTQSGGEWTDPTDVLNANPWAQVDADRLCAVGTSANNLPTMVFDQSDVYRWPLSTTINNMATKLGYWLWFKPAAVASVQRLIHIAALAEGATANKLQLYANSAATVCECYISGVNGRFGSFAASLSAGAWHSIYMQYDSSRGGDANLAIYVNGVAGSLTYGDLGAGGTLGSLPQPTGNILIGGATDDDDTPTQPIIANGEFGPNLFVFNDNLTAAEIAAIQLFERPT